MVAVTVWWLCVYGGGVCMVAVTVWWLCVYGGGVCMVAVTVWWRCVSVCTEYGVYTS